MIVWLVKCIIVLFSLSGYILFFRKKLRRIPELFIPVFVVSVIANALLVAGYVGILKEFAYLIYFTGIAFMLFYGSMAVRRNACDTDKGMTATTTTGMTAFYMLWFFIAVIMGVYLYGRINITHDDYSHWGIIIKRILKADKLPDSGDTFIQFQSYPEGISVFDYFVCRMTDGNDWSMQWAQFLVNWACLLPLFYGIGRRRKLGILLVTAYSLLVLNVNVPMRSCLSVDTVIALLGAIPFICLLMYIRSRDERAESDFESKLESKFESDFGSAEMSVFLGVVLGFLTMVKTSGLYFFIFFVIVYILNYKGNAKIRNTIIIAGIPVVINCLWQIHFHIAFPQGNLSNHAVSIGRYARIIATRNVKDIFIMFYNFIGNCYGTECYYTVLVMLILYAAIRCTRKYKADRRILDISIWAYVSWMLCLILMYLFSMEDGNLTGTDSIERYRRTIEIFVYMLWIVFLIYDVTEVISFKKAWKSFRSIFTGEPYLKIAHSARTNVEGTQIVGFMSQARDIITVIAIAVVLISMPKDPYGPYKGWKMYMDVRMDLEEALHNQLILPTDHVILYRNMESFKSLSEEEMKHLLAPYQYYQAQYALDSTDITLVNSLSLIGEDIACQPPDKGIVLYILMPSGETIELNEKLNYKQDNKFIRIR